MTTARAAGSLDGPAHITPAAAVPDHRHTSFAVAPLANSH